MAQHTDPPSWSPSAAHPVSRAFDPVEERTVSLNPPSEFCWARMKLSAVEASLESGKSTNTSSESAAAYTCPLKLEWAAFER